LFFFPVVMVRRKFAGQVLLSMTNGINSAFEN